MFAFQRQCKKYLKIKIIISTILVIGYLICIIIFKNKIDVIHRSSFSIASKERLTTKSAQKALDQQRISSVWIKSKKKKNEHLKHVINAFKAINYDILELEDDEIPDKEWNAIWAHNYPFQELKSYFLTLKTTHCINHFPGTGFITNKVTLASSGILSIPKAFRIPQDKSELLRFAKSNPTSIFVQKSSNHRGISIKKFENLNFEGEGTFIQEYMHDPLLVDGYKFDIGVYTVITSVNPLRVYIFEEVLFRFCLKEYHPFFANDSKKYVVGDDYRPTWEVPSLHHFYKIQNLGMRGSFDSWLRSNSKDPAAIWSKVQKSIQDVFFYNENHIIDNSKFYPSNLKFFEVMRFDFIIDAKLDVYLMEANMSPNLSSAHFKENRLLYEQVMFNLLSLVGLSSHLCSVLSPEEQEMKCSKKDIAVYPEHCSNQCRDSSECSKVDCQLCHPCLSDDLHHILCTAFLEHTWRGSYRRVIPKKPFKFGHTFNTTLESNDLSPRNTLMAEWFRGKCLLDSTFCS